MQFEGGAASWERRSVEGEEAAEGGCRGEGAEAGEEAAVAGGQAVGELVERLLDRGAELLQRGTVIRARREAGVDGVGQLAGQVGTQAAQAAGGGGGPPRGRRPGGAAGPD